MYFFKVKDNYTCLFLPSVKHRVKCHFIWTTSSRSQLTFLWQWEWRTKSTFIKTHQYGSFSKVPDTVSHNIFEDMLVLNRWNSYGWRTGLRCWAWNVVLEAKLAPGHEWSASQVWSGSDTVQYLDMLFGEWYWKCPHKVSGRTNRDTGMSYHSKRPQEAKELG